MWHIVFLITLMVLAGTVSCRSPEPEPQFQSYIDSASVIAYDIDGQRLEYSAQDCEWVFDERDHDRFYSVVYVSCGDAHDIESYHETRGHVFSEYQQDREPRSYASFSSRTSIKNEPWPWPHYADLDDCKHDPDNGFVSRLESRFEMRPLEDASVIPADFDEGYQAVLLYLIENVEAGDPCMLIEVRGGFFVKH